MGWINAAGIIIMVAGVLLLFSGDLVNRLSQFFGVTIIMIDEKMAQNRFLVGALLVAAGLWLGWIAMVYSSLWYFYIIAGLALLCGALYLVFSKWLKPVSQIANQLIFCTDDVVIHSRRITGLGLLVVSIYIFYSVSKIRS